ncbi:unnamed protein product, partial [Candidula unifasciata]
ERNERNERHGHGTAVLPNKDVYEGNYLYGKRDGYGVYRFRNKLAKNARYLGEYSQGKKQGFGKFIYPDGSKYEGFWVNDLKDGTGKYYYTNGDIYEGDWSKGLRHGKGTYYFHKDKTKYVGAWRKGKWEGFGEFHYANFKYCGRFRDNKMYGFGKYVFDVACELHGKYVPDNREETGEEVIQMIDIEQEVDLVVAAEVGQSAEGQPLPLVDKDGAIFEEPLLRMPASPPPIGPTHFVAGLVTGLHVNTPEEEEEARLVEELNALRKKVEAQIQARKEAEQKRAEAEAARWAREEAERVTQEIMAEGGELPEDVGSAEGQPEETVSAEGEQYEEPAPEEETGGEAEQNEET